MADQLSGTFKLSHTQYPSMLVCAAHPSMAGLTLADLTWTLAPTTDLATVVHTLETIADDHEERVTLQLDQFGYESTDTTMPGLNIPLTRETAQYNSQDWVLVRSLYVDLMRPPCDPVHLAGSRFHVDSRNSWWWCFQLLGLEADLQAGWAQCGLALL